jgi:hypothetical protein
MLYEALLAAFDQQRQTLSATFDLQKFVVSGL